ncbi:MAG: helix-turn-helix transcriptional regulator [Moorellales bacterium]
MQLSQRQAKIVELVRVFGPLTSEEIARQLQVTRAALRPDLAILTMAGILGARPRVGYYYSGRSLVAEALRRYRVGDIKSVPVVVTEETSVYDAAVTMFLEDVGTLFVVRPGGLLEGVVSRKDLLRATLGGAEVQRLPVSVLMTRRPHLITTTPEESVYAAAKKMVEHEVDALPVVKPLLGPDGEEQGLEVVGRITKTNIARLFVELGEEV